MEWYELFLRIFISLILGALIGVERNIHLKDAGIRTHGIVSFGACIFMLISQFAFKGEEQDASRIAAQIVSGVGFLGVGIMVYRKGAMQGLTTAAGIWATSAIGMCCGAYNKIFLLVAVFATVLIILFHCILHLPIKFIRRKTERIVKIKYSGEFNYAVLSGYNKLLKSKVEKIDGIVLNTIFVSVVNDKLTLQDLNKIVVENENVKLAELTDEA